MKHWVRATLEDALKIKKSEHIFLADDVERIARLVEKRDVYAFRNEKLEGLSIEISECESLAHLSKLMWEFATTCGFQNYAIFALQHGDGQVFETRVSTSFSEEWLDRYDSKGYQFIDPVVVHAESTDGWFEFSELSSSSPVVADFWLDAEAHRVGRNGFCVVFSRKNRARIGVSFVTSNSAKSVSDIVRRSGSDLVNFARIACDSFCFLSSMGSFSDEVLTAEELRFLYILATSGDPNAALTVYPKFGSNRTLQASIRSKLSVSSIYQALAIASANRWFDQLPFSAKEVIKPYPTLAWMEDEADWE